MIGNLTELIQSALNEDLSDNGDVTSLATVQQNAQGKARIFAKERGIIAGGFVVENVFSLLDPSIHVEIMVEDGTEVSADQQVIAIQGSLRGILTGERTALNFLCRLSGIATLTSQFVKLTEGTGVRILDTRKTTPGMRLLEKYAVRTGGGYNHRIGLYDMFLIKENHITAAGSITNAVTLCREYMKSSHADLKIEVETRTLDEVREALQLRVNRIMLDNMSIEQAQQAVILVNKAVKLEISGGVNLENVSAYARTGVDYISIGGLTHSAKALDLSLLVE